MRTLMYPIFLRSLKYLRRYSSAIDGYLSACFTVFICITVGYCYFATWRTPSHVMQQRCDIIKAISHRSQLICTSFQTSQRGGNIWQLFCLAPRRHPNVFPVSFQPVRRPSSCWLVHRVQVAGLALFIAEIFARWRSLSVDRERPAKSVRCNTGRDRVTRPIIGQLLHTNSKHTQPS